MRLTDPAAQWELYGQLDPYYGVATSDEYHRESLTPEGLKQFFASGAEYLDWLFKHLEGPEPRSALDFGCGVGRVLVALAQRCEEVTGVDVAPSMLAECQRVCAERGIQNVRLTEQLPDERFDLVHSTIVLQHIPLDEGYRLIGELARRVSVGGVGALHVSLRASTVRARMVSWTTKWVPFAANVSNFVRGRAWAYPHMQATSYRLERVLDLLAARGISESRTIYLPATNPMRLNSAMIIFAGAESSVLAWTPWSR